MIVIVQRLTKNDEPTLGTVTDAEHHYICASLERPATGDHPCIPAGVYSARRDWHHPNDPHRYKVWELRNVPGRSEIQLHIANKASQLLGCIAPGERHGMLDGEPAVLSSGDAFRRFMDLTAHVEELTFDIRDPA